jgi:formyltetrahydrofolate deformylase
MPDSTKHILLMDGPDRKGLIYHVTGVLYRHNLNIIHNAEYVSPAGQFFMRTEFEGYLTVKPCSANSVLRCPAQTMTTSIALMHQIIRLTDKTLRFG